MMRKLFIFLKISTLLSSFFFLSTVFADSEKGNFSIAKQSLDDVVLGAQDARVTVIEYSSMSCPICAYLHNDIFPIIEKDYINTGKVKWIFRHYPIYPNDIKAAAVTLCGGSEKYYIFIKALFKTQQNWVHESRNSEETLEHIAKLGGIDKDHIQQCFMDKNLEDKILDSREKAQNETQINATPTIIIEGEIYKEGISKKGLIEAIDSVLKKS